jgi:nitroimidazol reductase NimA-like FMN-containing flavoprotein (pyridoxamine 5'-phosphate oxidase superfamily)
MGIQLSSEIKALLDRPNFVHLATLMADGSPQSVPVWVRREGDHVLICTGDGSLKARNTLRDPRVARSQWWIFATVPGGAAAWARGRTAS